jgi:hypothetical protein
MKEMKNKIAFAFMGFAAALSADVKDLNWNLETYEPRTPALSGSVADGFHGAVTPMKRVDH